MVFLRSSHCLIPFKTSVPWPVVRKLSHVIGIETSCDDTGVALLRSDGQLIHEKMASQASVTTILGGVLPTIAQNMHAQYLRSLTTSMLSESNVYWKDIDTIAVTVKPGMALSLEVGLNYAREVAQREGIPIIPVHHMEAHALTAMFSYPDLKFPYLVLLLSGGHALIALVRDLEDFVLLGTTLDTAPGSVLDKLARRLKLSRLNYPQLRDASGGRALEICAGIHPSQCSEWIELASPRSRDKDCDFSFSGFLISAERAIDRLETRARDNGKPPNEPLPLELLSTLCQSIQYALMKQVCNRLQRAFKFLNMNHSLSNLPWPTALVISGGVAANTFLRFGLKHVADHYQVPFVAPPPRLCTDNGVMVAWNGLLLRRAGSRIVTDYSSLDFEANAPFGVDCRALVREANIKISPILMKELCQSIGLKKTPCVS